MENVTEKTVEFIESKVDEIEELLVQCTSIRSASVVLNKLKECDSLINLSLDKVLKSRKKVIIPVRKRLIVLSNHANGIYEGISSRTITIPEFKAEIEKIRTQRLPNIRDFLSLAKESLAVNIGNDDTQSATSLHTEIYKLGDFKEALKIFKNYVPTSESISDSENPVLSELEKTKTLDAARDERLEINLQNGLNLIMQMKNKLPTRIKGQYEVYRLPVVPIFETPPAASDKQININALHKYILPKVGITSVSLESRYIVLDEQLLLAIDKKKADSILDEEIVRKSKRVTTNTHDYLAYAKAILSVINEKASSPYALVSDKSVVNSRNTNIVFYWIMPRRTLSVLLVKGWKRLARWGFPW